MKYINADKATELENKQFEERFKMKRCEECKTVQEILNEIDCKQEI